MDIKCKECGSTINLDESIRNQILEKEIGKHEAELTIKFQKEINELKNKFEDDLIKSKSEASENFENEIRLLKEQRKLDKEHELNLKKEKMMLEDALQEAEILAEKKSALMLNEKKAELEKRNDDMLQQKLEQSRLELDEFKRDFTSKMESNLREKELENQRLIKKVEEAQSELSVAKSSQELTGEAAEILLLEKLQKNFPYHTFDEIKKGQTGADIIQNVTSRSGKVIGQIYFESKKTKRWSEQWVQKFKDDIRKKGAYIGILVSEALPDNCSSFIFRDGIWITSPRYVIALTGAVAREISEVSKAKGVQLAKTSLEGGVYDYICSSEFIEKMKVIAEAHRLQQEDLEKEEKAFKKIWAKRRKNIERSFENLAEIFGDLESLSAGNVKSLEDFDLKITE